jgi:hypothetical protein
MTPEEVEYVMELVCNALSDLEDRIEQLELAVFDGGGGGGPRGTADVEVSDAFL